ncbi:MAG: stalled ribosome rescue protein Dom34 [Cyclobacteriaceae bacterium]|jgi:stalled ribosome rescue protein Dom34
MFNNTFKNRNLKLQKNLGIWMDHSTADLIGINAKSNTSIASKFTTNTKEEALNRSESLMHNKRQQMHEAYYKEISDEILNYDHVLLFGPTNAKSELQNYLNKDLHFKRIKIDIESADNMTVNEKDAYVKSHFEHSN